MATSTLLTHCGARQVRLEELATVEAPPPTQTWFPIKHSVVVETVAEALVSAGFAIRQAKFALSRNDARLFSTLDLATGLGSGVSLCVGIRNSTDKSLPLGFVAGNRVFVCDNLSFRSELLVTRKHTRFGGDRFKEAICQAVQSLHQFREQETARIQRMQHTPISEDRALALLMHCWEEDVLSHRLLPIALKEWRDSQFEEFREPTLWSLYNAATFALAARATTNPQAFAAATIRLGSLLLPAEPVLTSAA